MTDLSSLAAIEQGHVQRANGYRLIVLPLGAVAPLQGRDGSPWMVFPTKRGTTLLAISDEDYADALIDFVARTHRGEKTSDIETLLIRRLAHPGELDQANTLVPVMLAAQEQP